MPDVNGPVVTDATAVPIPAVNGPAVGALDAVVARATAVLRALAVAFGLLFVLIWHSWYAAAPWRVVPPLLSLGWGVVFAARCLRHGPLPRLVGVDVGLDLLLALCGGRLVPPPSVGDGGNWVFVAVFSVALAAGWSLPPLPEALAVPTLGGPTSPVPTSPACRARPQASRCGRSSCSWSSASPGRWPCRSCAGAGGPPRSCSPGSGPNGTPPPSPRHARGTGASRNGSCTTRSSIRSPASAGAGRATIPTPCGGTPGAT